MAKAPRGDLVGARWEQAVIANGALASNGASARVGQQGPYPHDVRVAHAYWTPLGADQASTVATNYRRLSLVDGGPLGTVVPGASNRLATLNVNASAPSLGPVAMVCKTTQTLAAGNVLYFYQETVGAADANGTVLVAGQVNFDFEVV